MASGANTGQRADSTTRSLVYLELQESFSTICSLSASSTSSNFLNLPDIGPLKRLLSRNRPRAAQEPVPTPYARALTLPHLAERSLALAALGQQSLRPINPNSLFPSRPIFQQLLSLLRFPSEPCRPNVIVTSSPASMGPVSSSNCCLAIHQSRQ